ncbi:MAG: beta-glucuronidase [Ignavibacteria bacterium GWB2_36_8]|nr:MAG: beta-glucuronidase [Ignavibacteria bacterium GWB2_36_8]OGU50721.1 MAG: beta-glucuronidase [Ignavibacteria bacterium GWC2_36_12]
MAFLNFYATYFAQSSSLISNIDGRKTFSLDGYWKIIVDPYENGFYNYRYDERDNGYFKNQKPKSKSDLVEYDFDKSDSLKVPGDWNTQKEKLFLYEGTIWYKKDFDYNLTSGKRLFVYFGAANYKAIIYLNGTKLGEHEGGFTPFNFEITELAKEKANFLIVKVDNKRSREFVPTVNTDWWNYGGITRNVFLVEVPQTYIKDYFIQLDKNSNDEISGWIKLDGERLKQKVDIKIPELRKEISINTDENGLGKFTFSTQPILWSPENPKLYDVKISSERDSISDKIGFRRIETKDGKILLNGKPIFLRGISCHEEAPIRGGRANSKEDAETILKWVKELNGNFIRLAHYPHRENFIRVADEMGILVWSEIPVYWTILWDNKETFRNAENQLTEMITRDKNRASIILWSVANETPLSDERLNFLTKLTEQARKLDNTRLLTAALENHYINESTIVIDDPFGKYLDVVGLNEYLGWYDGLPDKIAKINYVTVYNKPIIVSEFGAGALQGLYGDKMERWTEEYQSYVYEEQIKLMKKMPNLGGMSPWILMDFRSPRRPLPGIQDFYNRKGLISDKGIKKKAFYILQEFYKGFF